MYLNLEPTRRLAQVLYYIFVVFTCINKVSITLVSSENASNIPLRLYQTKQLQTPHLQNNVLDENTVDAFKRGIPGAFYGLRGKKLPVNLISNSMEEKRTAFYPMRGKKKAAAFTALRGKKESNTDSYDAYNKDSSQMLHDKNSTPIQNNINSERLQSHMNLKANSFASDDEGPSADDPYAPFLHTDNESENTHSWNNPQNEAETDRDSSEDIRSNIIDDDNKYYDDILSKINEDNRSNDEQIVNKRRNSGFIPMRGRKFNSKMIEQFTNDKRKSSFIPMRGRKWNYMNEWSSTNKELPSDIDKKSSVGFLPMRGRRSIFSQSRTSKYQHKTRWPFSEGKRVAFHAVRGKKNSMETDWNYPTQDLYSSQNGNLDEYDNEDIGEYNEPYSKNFPTFSNQESVLRIRRSPQGKLTRGKSKATV